MVHNGWLSFNSNFIWSNSEGVKVFYHYLGRAVKEGKKYKKPNLWHHSKNSNRYFDSIRLHWGGSNPVEYGSSLRGITTTFRFAFKSCSIARSTFFKISTTCTDRLKVIAVSSPRLIMKWQHHQPTSCAVLPATAEFHLRPTQRVFHTY